MYYKIYWFLFLLAGLTACQPKPTPHYVEVPTVTDHALSGIYSGVPEKQHVRLYTEAAGKGDTMILLHGYGSDLRMWDAAFCRFTKHFFVVRYDLRGYGRSDMPEVGYGYLHADDLRALMDALQLRKAHLVGVSLGGRVVTEFVALYPDRVNTAIIASGALTHIPDRSSVSASVVKAYNDTVFAYNARKVRNNDSIGVATLKEDWKRAMKQISGKRYSRIKKDLNAMIDDWAAWQWTHPEVDALMGDQADSLLSLQQVHPPVLLLMAQFDHPENKKSMMRMSSVCPTARIQNLQEVGHFSPMEDPSEFCRRVIAFIER